MLFVFAQFAKAQVKVGDNPTTINKGSILELESPDKGLLFPRIALTNTTTWSLATGSLPVAGMVVYNTKKVADGFAGTIAYPTTLPDGTGLYYWDSTGWVATKGAAAASNDWTILGNTGTNAGINYLGTTDAVDLVFRTTATERMRVTAGGNIDIPNSTPTTAIITKAGLPFIHNNGTESTAVGVGALNLAATGRRNDALGYEALGNVTSGFENTALGRFSLHTLTEGSENMAVGGRTLENLQTGSRNTAIGRSVMPGLVTGSNNVSIGSLSSVQIQSAAIKNTVIGTEAGGSLLPGFGIGSSNVLIGYQAGYSHTGDNRLMIDVSGTNTPLIDGDFATRILTVNNTLKVADLAGVGDRPVVADVNGQLKIGAAVPAGGASPWNLESTLTAATLNTQNIYQNGNVGIGDFSAAATKPIAKLDVRGALRGGNPDPAELSGASLIGENSVAFGDGNKVSGMNSFATGTSNTSTGTISAAFGTGNITSGDVSTAWGLENKSAQYLTTTFGANNENLGIAGTIFGVGNKGSSEHQLIIGKYNAITDGSYGSGVATDAAFQIGFGSTPTSRLNLLTVMKSGKTAIGVSGAEAAAKPTELLDLGGSATTGNGGLKIRNINTPAYTSTNAADKVVVADATGVLKTISTSALTTTSIIKITANYTALATDYTILANATSAGFTLTLPSAASSTGRILIIRKTDETANILTFSAPIKISETTSFTTLNVNTTIRIQSDGTDWYKID